MSKKDAGKPEMSLVYRSIMVAISRIRRFGIEKYEHSEEWRTTEPIKYCDAILRHLFNYMEGDELDEESGFPHLYHIACNVMFLIEREHGGKHATTVRHKSSSGLLNLKIDTEELPKVKVPPKTSRFNGTKV